MTNLKTAESLTLEDIKSFPVWRFTNHHEESLDETAVVPVKRLPVSNLSNKIVGTLVTLSNFDQLWAILGNIKTNDVRLTEQFISATGKGVRVIIGMVRTS
jgi:hypothetical protein